MVEGEDPGGGVGEVRGWDGALSVGFWLAIVQERGGV